jgi:mono/diheme cytochrome c family protein
MKVDLKQREARAMAAHDEKIAPPRYVRSFVRGVVGSAAVVVILASSWSPLGAQTPELDEKQKQAEAKVPDPKNGLILARKLCSTCHLIGEPINASTPADIPSFPSIANRPNQSAEALTNWLVAPHAPMPDPHLTRKEIRDIAVYILSLRTAK